MLLEVEDVSKSFGGLQAVKNATFEVPEAQVTGLVGPNGAGKTTVFNMISGTIRADAGSIRYRDTEITGLSPQARIGRGIARSFQDVRLLPKLTVLENVVVGVQGQPGERLRNVFTRPWHSLRSEQASRRRAAQCLDYVGMPASVHHELAGSLSYGEQKLVAIARLLATGADLLLLDEPTSGLDEGSLDEFRAVLRRLISEGRTVLLVEHNMLLVRELCDRAVFLSTGEVLAVDTPSRLMENEELRDVYFGA
ncbi:ABC transporter ATP-binding protein [Geodermatophilus sp. DSM 44513]|uniref:ABC transporter ATP-binding protein n=1 Tax=Geodermatophilus sp. DSM 44513 TaxID=1528104 RepID=UPI001272479A|nr:ABC transporter ATP-binding protein [Geodermatophilus sp. DSM 44513]WNV76630.1 ABC transporter ATP-binding protein [Geodermatophilus sp. DSM 44513]